MDSRRGAEPNYYRRVISWLIGFLFKAMSHILRLARMPYYCQVRLCQPAQILEVYQETGIYEEKANKHPLEFIGYKGKCSICERISDGWVERRELES